MERTPGATREQLTLALLRDRSLIRPRPHQDRSLSPSLGVRGWPLCSSSAVTGTLTLVPAGPVGRRTFQSATPPVAGVDVGLLNVQSRMPYAGKGIKGRGDTPGRAHPFAQSDAG